METRSGRHYEETCSVVFDPKLLCSDEESTCAEEEEECCTDDEETFEVAFILDDRVVDGERQFKVRWAGYGEEEDSWEPEENLENAKELVKEYLNRNPRMPREKRTIVKRYSETYSRTSPYELTHEQAMEYATLLTKKIRVIAADESSEDSENSEEEEEIQLSKPVKELWLKRHCQMLEQRDFLTDPIEITQQWENQFDSIAPQNIDQFA